MKVMQIVADGAPGGGTTNVLALAEDLIANQVAVMLCSQAASHAIDEARRLGAKAHDGLDFFRSRLDTRIVRELRSAVHNADPDIIHVHGGRAALAWVRGADRGQLDRTIYTVRGYHFRPKRFPLRFLAKRAERRISRSVFKTVHVSQSDKEVAMHFGFIRDGSASQVIRNGIRLSDMPRHQPVSANEDQNRKQVAVLGRLTYPKNPHLVLDIANDLAQDGFVFHFIGGGDMEFEVRQRAEREGIQNVVFHGTQSRPNGLKLMAQSGTFLLASLWEGLPIAPVEAMAMGLAVVISDVNGCTEVVRDGMEGRVAPSGNGAAFVAALRAVVAEPERTQQLVVNGKQRVAAEFTRERVVREHLNLYHDCLSKIGSRNASS
ncbi:glycosyltransferase family 4 protein [Novipirellula artificiosorum]|uniref:Putative glycosyltransferase EpsD n=1 Tax=Novipirellula artificiosorum TaxID=2528016 RepID=A0A5C6DQT9_9BACT|nr:glycosyltransferase family 4 protein [Novipirellula artificiosorum]TWU39200.1 putative glycosyltransferase EpsD [Novipirellula artificiosorum]